MTREELTREIAKRLKDIRELYYSVYPEGSYISMHFEKDVISFNNRKWEGGEDEGYQIDYCETEEYIMMNGEYKDKWC